MPTRILGLSAFYHDSAACLIVDGRIEAAAQEERFTRRRHDPSFPTHAIAYCLESAGIGPESLDLVGFYEKPLVKFERLLQTYVARVPRSLSQYMTAMPAWLGGRLWIHQTIEKGLPGFSGDVYFGEHHESHAASAFYPSPFEHAAILTVDGVGEWATSTIGIGEGARLDIASRQNFPHSLGLFYSTGTYLAGFRVNSGEYKLMGLAPYGRPSFVNRLRDEVIDIRDDGSVWLNLKYFDFVDRFRMASPALEALLEAPARVPESALTQHDMDVARSFQSITEDAMLKMARHARAQTGATSLCLAGGVALNCVANGRIARAGLFDAVWVPPAPGDAGGAVGCALSLWHRFLGRERISAERAGTWRQVPADPGGPRHADGMEGALLGPSFSEAEIVERAERFGWVFERLDLAHVPGVIARELAQGQVVALFQGRMEFGPRALGARSIIGDPRSPTMQSVINQRVKLRESFRPFAPSVLVGEAATWFEFTGDSPYMSFVATVDSSHRLPEPPGTELLSGLDRLRVPRSDVPAVTHVDGSARLQTVHPDVHPVFHSIIEAFYEETGCPMVVNTSFNVRGEPIVCTPEDAYRCFVSTGLDVLVMENLLFRRAAQPVTVSAAAERVVQEFD